MARKTGGKGQGSKHNSHGNVTTKPRGPSSDSQALRTRPIEELLGVEALDFGMENEILTPKSSVQHLQLRSEVRHSFNEWMQQIHHSSELVRQNRANMDVGTISVPILQQLDEISVHNNDEVGSISDKSVSNKSVENLDPIQIDLDDIQEEIEFWNSAILCYVVGANPPAHVMEGFVRRIWKNHKLDKVVMVKKGMFLVRFHTMDMRDKVLTGHFFFDGKPLIMKPWSVDMDMEKEEIRSVPIWIQLKLNIKYWGEKALFKIVNQIGKPVKRDSATTNRDKFHFARVLVDMPITHSLPDQVSFMDEHGELIKVDIKYEWKPSKCGVCKMVGHQDAECRQGNRKAWVQKHSMQPVKPMVQAPAVDQEGFQQALRPIRVRNSIAAPTHLKNTFHLLNEEEIGEVEHVVVEVDIEDGAGELGGGNSSHSYG